MQIINFTKAFLFNSGKAAYRLTLDNPRYSSFAIHIISVKNNTARLKLERNTLDTNGLVNLNAKIANYERYLRNLAFLNYQPR